MRRELMIQCVEPKQRPAKVQSKTVDASPDLLFRQEHFTMILFVVALHKRKLS